MSDIAAFQYLRREDDDFHEMKDRELEEWLNLTMKPYVTTPWASTSTSGARVYTALVSQSSSTPSFTATVDRWRFVGQDVEWNFEYGFTSAGTAGSPVLIRTPFAIADSHTTAACGQVLFYDASPATRYNLMAERNLSNVIALGADGGTGDLFGQSPSIAIASGDVVRGYVRWRYR